MLPCFTGLDPAERDILEAALAQHASSPDSDGGLGRVATAARQPVADAGAPLSQAVPPSGATVPVAATVADGWHDIMETLCCPITHVRLCPPRGEVFLSSIGTLIVP